MSIKLLTPCSQAQHETISPIYGAEQGEVFAQGSKVPARRTLMPTPPTRVVVVTMREVRTLTVAITGEGRT
jgi:hypothetical protein